MIYLNWIPSSHNMKTKLINLPILTTILVSCSKNDEVTPNQTATIKKKSLVTQSAPRVVYANLACKLDDGRDGCQCAITESDDDCSEQTSCAPSSDFPHYDDVLHQLFTNTEIDKRAANGVRITEPQLIEALIIDGYPLKNQ